MATQLDPNVKDDLKTQFVTREGTYRLLTLSEYSRPNRVGYTNSQSSPQVRVSIVTLPNVNANANTTGTGTGTNTPMSGGGTLNGNSSNNNNSNPTNSSNNGPCSSSTATPPSNGSGDGSAATSPTSTTAVTTLNGHGGGPYGVPAGMDARLGAGISMHSMMNGVGGSGNGGGIDQNASNGGGLYNQIYGGDRICFNFGRELYVYAFRGVKKGSEMSKPIDKKFYKGTNPSCHDFNATAATPTGAPLLVGFTTGQIQLISPQPGPRELRKLFNEERLIDRTKVTCLKWLPNSTNLFLASHASGHLYLYNEDLTCSPPTPNYQPFKVGDGYTILTCKSKSTRNPLYKWVFSTENCCINEFCFSPCGSNLAIVSQDGFLRVFHYDTMELLGIARSYFGGFLCVCWSPDGKYIVVGGEDDLVTVWSLHERRVVARGQGHRSWVSVVAFDPYTTSYTTWDSGEFSDDENQMNEYMGTRESRFSGDSTTHGFDFNGVGEKNSTPNHTTRQRPHSASFRSDASSSAALPPDKLAISYRLGSVSQDTQICLWDITEDVLRHPLALRQRVNSTQLNDTSYMNGGVDSDGVKVIRPIAIGSTSRSGSGSFPPPQHASSPIKETALGSAGGGVATAEHSSSTSNSSSSKFSTANCTISSSHSSSANTPPEDTATTSTIVNGASGKGSSSGATTTTTTTTTLKFPNCISGGSSSKCDAIDGNQQAPHPPGKASNASTSTFYTSGYNSKSSNSSNKSSDSGLSTFNSLTQRLANFSFLSSSSSDKQKADSGNMTISSSSSSTTAPHRNHRKTLSLLKSYNNHTSGHSSSTNATAIEFHGGNSSTASHSFGSLKLGRSNAAAAAAAAASSTQTVITSYDPMKLIGTPACPRFDECPLLEPLVCKKIAHERLSALIFREDCFLTACQDGFIYTWARPGYATTVPQHISPTQTAPPGGTVI